MECTTKSPSNSIVPKKCCSNCSEPRTYTQFMRNHVKTYVPVSEDDTCRICWGEYGSWNQAFGCEDVPCRIVGIDKCNHVFGWGCITDIVCSSSTSICPLCGTPWFTRASIDQDGRGVADEPEAQKVEASREVASMFKVDYATARCRTYMEPEYQKSCQMLRHIELEADRRRFELVFDAVNSEEIQELVTGLLDSSNSPPDERLYDPYRGAQELYAYNDPFTFCNWHVNNRMLAVVAHYALVSNNGTRLIELLSRARDASGVTMEIIRATLGEDMTEEEVEDEAVRIELQILDETEKAWVEWYGEEHVRTFSRFLLEVWLVMMPQLGPPDEA